MKINLNKVKLTAVSALTGSVCVYGQPDTELQTWVADNKLPCIASGPYTNICLAEVADIASLFAPPQPILAVDGFSPNLNKHLHLGHLSNFVIAKAIQSLGIGNLWFAVLGDTLAGGVVPEAAYKAYQNLCCKYGYKVNQTYFASKQTFAGNWLVPGTGEFEGCQIFQIGNKQVVGIKSNGATSYFYQDVAVAFQMLGVPTLYITGLEQSQHFADLKVLFPNVLHLPLGHVTINNKKMSTREGDLIPASEVLDYLLDEFQSDELAWNVLAGYLLKSAPQTNKSIDWNMLKNPKQSSGLYLSYTMAKCFSAGLDVPPHDTFQDPVLQLSYLYAQHGLAPHFLLGALVNKAKQISQLYEQYPIKGNPAAMSIYQMPLGDMALGLQKLGMYKVSKVSTTAGLKTQRLVKN